MGVFRFRDVSFQRGAVLEVRVYLNNPGVDAETSVDDARCVGVFTLYRPHAGHGSVNDWLTIDLEGADAVRSLQADEKGRSRFPLTTVVVPSPQAAAEAGAERVRYKSAGVVAFDFD